MSNSITTAFAATVFGKVTDKLITAYFTNRSPADYPVECFHDLMEDPIVTSIIDSDTGEVLYDKRLNYIAPIMKGDK